MKPLQPVPVFNIWADWCITTTTITITTITTSVKLNTRATYSYTNDLMMHLSQKAYLNDFLDCCVISFL